MEKEEIGCYKDALKYCDGNMQEASKLWKEVKGTKQFKEVRKETKKAGDIQKPTTATFEDIVNDEDRLYRILNDNDVGNARSIVDMWANVPDLGKLDDPRWLSECLEDGRVHGSKRRTILSVWFGIRHKELQKVIEEEEEGKTKEKAVKVEKKTLDELLDETVADEMKELKRLQMRKRIQDIEKEIRSTVKEEGIKKSEDEVLRTHILDDGSSIRVTDREWLEHVQAMARIEMMRAKKEKEAEEEKIPFDYHGHIIKISPAQIPYMQSMQHNPQNDVLKKIEEKLEEERRNVDRLERERTEDRIVGYIGTLKEEQNKMKEKISQDPLDAFLGREEKLEKLGYSRGRKSMEEHGMELEKIDRTKRLDMLENQYGSLQKKVDKILDIAAPVIRKRMEKTMGEERRGALKDYSPEELQQIEQKLKAPPEFKKKIKVNPP